MCGMPRAACKCCCVPCAARSAGAQMARMIGRGLHSARHKENRCKRKRHQQEHRPQRPTERSDPTQHAKGRAGDCPGPRKETATRRNVTRGEGGGGDSERRPWHCHFLF